MLKDILVQDYPTVFQNSVVMLDKSPYYIIGFDGKYAECLNIETQDIDTFDFTQFSDIKIPNTGYFNYRGVCCYISRYPCRKYKHGLSSDNIRIMSHAAPCVTASIKIKDCKEQAMYLRVKALSHMYKNKYPTFEEAIQMLKKQGVYSVAFDRQFAIHRDGTVSYKTRFVGVISKNKIVLEDYYTHLKIALPKGCI